MICHSFSRQSSSPSSGEMQNIGLKNKGRQDDLFRGRRRGGGGGGGMGRRTGRPFTLPKAVWTTMLMNATLPAAPGVLPSREALRGDKSNSSQTADSFLLVWNLGSKCVPQDKKNIRRNQKELFRDNSVQDTRSIFWCLSNSSCKDVYHPWDDKGLI